MKKILSVLLVVTMIFTMVGCGQADAGAAAPAASGTTEASQEAVQTEPAETAVSEESVEANEVTEEAAVFPVTVTDDAGREVTIEEKPQRIATTYTTTLNFAAALGVQDMFVGTNGQVMSPSIYEYIAPEFIDLPGVGRGVPELEALAELDVDLFIGRGGQVESLEAVQEMGITSLGLAPESVEEVMATYDLLGAAVGKVERANELKQAYTEVIEKAKALVAEIPEDQRYTAIVMGGEVGSVANSAMLQSYLIETAGGTNPAADLNTNELWPVVGVEQIFEWDPDFIFVTTYGFTDYTVDDLLNDPLWANTSAVKNNRIMPTPCNLESWEMPTPASALGVLWMIQKMYPEVYSDAELEADVKAYYDILYPGNTLTRDILGY